jgi:hypothetical protein
MPSCSYIVPFGTSAINEETPTEPTTTEPTTTEPPVINYLYGDVDLNGEINIRDVTTIQCAIASIESLKSNQSKFQADVTKDGLISINDATTIQQYLVGLITQFPATAVKETATTTKTSTKAYTASADFTNALTLVKKDLDSYYSYSSYDQYMALKKSYLNYKSANLNTTEQKKAISDLTAKQEKLYDIANNNTIKPSGEYTVYFTNTENWSTVKAYVWGSADNMAAWPGKDMTYVKTNSYGQKIYSISFSFKDYQKIIFTNGSAQTVDITLTGEENVGYYISGSSGGKFTCQTYKYS